MDTKIGRMTESPVMNGKHLYVCFKCGDTDWGNDRLPRHMAWRDQHFAKCWPTPKPKPKPKTSIPKIPEATETSGTRDQMVAAIERGEVFGIKWNPKAYRSFRYTWRNA